MARSEHPTESSRSTIVVHCDDCGDVRLAPHEVTIRTCVDDGGVTYRFVCAQCGLPSVGSTSAAAGRRAVEAGSQTEEWTYPGELFETHEGSAIDGLDVLAFRALLREPDWFDDLLRVHVERGGHAGRER